MERELFELLKRLEKGNSISKDNLSKLKSLGYADDNGITKEGLLALEPYRVKRAIIVAAGFGSRMVPITLTTPKPLVKVHGVRFIDTLINKLLKNGIKDIYVVRGYLKDKFDELLKEYPSIKFIDNDLYDKENNISSVIKAIDLVENTYLCEADFLVTGDDVIERYQYEINYLGTKVDETDDWCFVVDENNRAFNYRKGGKNCVQAFGISYWNKSGGQLLQKCLKEMYSNIKNRQEFWEMCIFDLYKEKFDIKCRYVSKDSIVEIDSYKELAEIDNSYHI